MCLFSGDFVKSPKVVGDKLEAGTYAKNDNGTPINSVVYLKGKNVETGAWLTFAQTTPDQTTGWAGMPLITLTDAHVGTWTMSWDVPGVSCAAGPYVLIVTKTATPIFLSSDKMSVQQGDTMTFSGKYKPGAAVNIYEDGPLPTHITQALCDGSGDFKVAVYNFNLAVSDQPHKIRACEPAALTECHAFGDASGAIYIYVSPRQACTPSWHCIQPLNGMEADGCGHNRANAVCNPPVPGKTCTEGETKKIPCPDDPAKTKTVTCVEGSWITTDDQCTDNTMLIVLGILIVVLFFAALGRQ